MFRNNLVQWVSRVGEFCGLLLAKNFLQNTFTSVRFFGTFVHDRRPVAHTLRAVSDIITKAKQLCIAKSRVAVVSVFCGEHKHQNVHLPSPQSSGLFGKHCVKQMNVLIFGF